MELLASQKKLRIFSNLMIVFAIIDTITLILGFVNGDFNSATIVETSGMPAGLVLTVLIIAVAISALIIAAKLYMGMNGLKRAKGIETNKGHITVGKIALICCIVLFAASALSLILNISNATIVDWLGLLSPFASCLIFNEYLKAAKEVG